MKRVLLADNYPLSRTGMRDALLNEIDDVKIIEASNEKELFELVKIHKLDLAIVALTSPGKTAAEIVKKLHNKFSGLPILIICIYPESLFAMRAFRIGASGYITRESNISELIKAVKKLLLGGIYVSGNILDNILKKHNKEGKEFYKTDALSDREMQIMQMLASGKTTKQIATEINLSMSTISTYRSRILKKLDLKTNSELTRFAIENALV